MNGFKWVARQMTEEDFVYYEGENDKFFAGLEHVGVDLHGNQMWSVSLFSKESGKPIPVSEYGTPFTSVIAAKEAIIRAIKRWEDLQ